jgi:hypothetical protein
MLILLSLVDLRLTGAGGGGGGGRVWIGEGIEGLAIGIAGGPRLIRFSIPRFWEFADIAVSVANERDGSWGPSLASERNEAGPLSLITDCCPLSTLLVAVESSSSDSSPRLGDAVNLAGGMGTGRS